MPLNRRLALGGTAVALVVATPLAGRELLDGTDAAAEADRLVADTGRFVDRGSALDALDAIRAAAVAERASCVERHGTVPRCEAWAAIAAYATIAAGVLPDCAPAEREVIRERLEAYIRSVRALGHASRAVPAPPGELRCPA